MDCLLAIWHTYRAQLCIVLTLCGLSVLLLRGRSRSRHIAPSLSPNSEEKSAWLDSGDGHGSARDTLDLGEKAASKPSLASSSETKKARPLAARVVTGQKPTKQKGSKEGPESTGAATVQPLIFFASLTGTTERLVRIVAESLTDLSSTNSSILSPQTFDLAYVELDDFFVCGPKVLPASPSPNLRNFYIILIPSYDIDTILTNFLDHLNETHHDFRIDTAPLAKLLGYTVFGVGDRQGWPSEKLGFCAQAIETDKWMAKLTGRKRAYPLGLGDARTDVEDNLREWTTGMCKIVEYLSISGGLGEGVPGSGDALESGDETEGEDMDFPESRRKRQKTRNAIDVEDLGGLKTITKSTSVPLNIDFTTSSSTGPATPPQLKEMVPTTSPTYTSLTKQGYTIVGSHSGVKICRWTKSALRGRGSCYKNSFYGIASHLCMETTPSLSCSNKCIFCWRHGTNPVSTTWRWQVDDPKMIFDGAKAGHYKKIKMMRGVPGVRAERFEEAMRIRHCALSLVGEPVFYPRINEFVDLLHGERISSFLVCNAQHPEELRRLKRVTQLYVSIDASNRESLRRIDRPLNRDFWERFQECLDIIRSRRDWQRTVYRLTLVKGFNVEDEAAGYAELIEKGLPGFVEVKGVTYCGTSTSKGAGLTMGNVPFWEEVVEFVEGLNGKLRERGLEYGIAAEHMHSCCVLLADKKFLRDGKWCTVIDYERFFQLLEGGEDFGPEDYVKETPEWAWWGNGGFDPRDERVDRKGRPKEMRVLKEAVEDLGIVKPGPSELEF